MSPYFTFPCVVVICCFCFVSAAAAPDAASAKAKAIADFNSLDIDSDCKVGTVPIIRTSHALSSGHIGRGEMPLR